MNVALVVNSCFKFYKTTIPILLESAKKAGVPFSQIYVVVGECNETKTDYPLNTVIHCKHNNNDEKNVLNDAKEEKEELFYNIIFCPYVNIDYNACVFFSQTDVGRTELQTYTHFFHIHDTCELMPEFWKNIQNDCLLCDKHIKLFEFYSKSIGLLNVNWFLNNKTELFSYFANTDEKLCLMHKEGKFANIDKIKSFPNLLENPNEDALFDSQWNAPRNTFYEHLNETSHIDGVKVTECNVYGTPRLKRIVSPPGIIKYQKNCASLSKCYDENGNYVSSISL